MRFLTTFLYALAVCMAFLVGAGLWIDAPRREMQSTGLTAATILGTDGPSAPAPAPVSSGLIDVGLSASVEG